MTKDYKKAGIYWMSDSSWYRVNPNTGDYVMTEAAPEEAKESFAEWKRKFDEDTKLNDESIAETEQL